MTRVSDLRRALAPVPSDPEELRKLGSVPQRPSLLRRVSHLVLSVHHVGLFTRMLDTELEAPEHETFRFSCLTDPADPLVDRTDDPALVRAALERVEEVNVVFDGDGDGAVFVGRSTNVRRSFREPFMGVRVHLVDGYDAWVGEGYTEPEYRRRGVGTFRGDCNLARLYALGVRRMYASIEDWNAASRGLTMSAGYTEVQQFSFVRVFRRYGFGIPWSITPRVHPLVRG